MPRSSIKDPELYERLRSEGSSKEKAARISNAAANTGRTSIARKGGRSESYEEWPVRDLRGRARELGLTGYSKLSKAQLIHAIRNH